MNLLPRVRSEFGHRRAHSSALEICSTTFEDQEIKGTQPLLEEKDIVVTSQTRRLDATLIILWALSVAFVSLLTYALTKSTKDDPFGGFRTGYLTDLAAARSAIHVRNEHFYGSLDFNGHHGFIPSGSPSLKYVGSGPDVDAAWENLTKDRYFLLSDDEAEEAFGNDHGKYWNVHHGGVAVGLDVLHTLHCLNHLRMSLYPDVYPQDPIDGPMHKAHCVDHLRQLVMCNADLTPVPTQYFEGLERNYINSSRVHTCRDFTKVREWALERFNGSTAVKPRNRDGSPRDNFYAPWGP